MKSKQARIHLGWPVSAISVSALDRPTLPRSVRDAATLQGAFTESSDLLQQYQLDCTCWLEKHKPAASPRQHN